MEWFQALLALLIGICVSVLFWTPLVVWLAPNMWVHWLLVYGTLLSFIGFFTILGVLLAELLPR